MTTPIRMRPWMTVARFGLTPRNVRSVRMSDRMNDGDDRPDHAAAAAGEAHATEHDGRHARAACRCPGPACRCRCSPVSASPPSAENRPVSA